MNWYDQILTGDTSRASDSAMQSYKAKSCLKTTFRILAPFMELKAVH